MSRTYEPRGRPKAAIEYVTRNGPTYSGPLAEAIDCDPGSLHAFLTSALHHGLLKKERKVHMGTSCNLYSLGDGAPVTATGPDHEPDEPLHEVPTPSLQNASVFAVAQAEARSVGLTPSDPVEKPEAAPPVQLQLAKAPVCEIAQVDKFECGLFSDGRLVMELDGQTITLPRSATEKLVAFLERLTPEVSA